MVSYLKKKKISEETRRAVIDTSADRPPEEDILFEANMRRIMGKHLKTHLHVNTYQSPSLIVSSVEGAWEVLHTFFVLPPPADTVT